MLRGRAGDLATGLQLAQGGQALLQDDLDRSCMPAYDSLCRQVAELSWYVSPLRVVGWKAPPQLKFS